MSQERCGECGRPIDAPCTHVYAVRVQTYGKRKKWFVSVPVPKKVAERHSAELTGTGYKTEVWTVSQAKKVFTPSGYRRVNGVIEALNDTDDGDWYDDE